MKITKSQLKQLIKEEIEVVMSEILPGDQKLPDIDPLKAIQMICEVKPAILLALDNPGFGRIILEGIFKAKGGEHAAQAINLVKTIEKQTGGKLEDILKMPFAKMIIRGALDMLCSANR